MPKTNDQPDQPTQSPWGQCLEVGFPRINIGSWWMVVATGLE